MGSSWVLRPKDSHFDLDKTQLLLSKMGPVSITEVEE